MKKSTSGFTIVELLIVIVVIAILAAISIVAYSGIQERARVTAATSDMNNLYKAILAARINTGQTLLQITGSGCTRCITPSIYAQTIDKISVASGMDLGKLKAGDPWGNEYWIDENEGEQIANPCIKDGILVVNHPEVTSGGKFQIPFVLSGCT